MSTTEKSKSEPTRSQRVVRRRRRLSYAEFAAENGVSIDTVRRMVKRGELEVDRVGLKCVRIVTEAD
jgi:DNA-directed RNA polymerase specialized sigma24 family protein